MSTERPQHAPSSTGVLARAQNIRCVYGGGEEDFTAVDGVSIALGEGEVLGLAGESGCGKTTLGNALAMIAAPPLYVLSGTLEIDDGTIDLSTLSAVGRQASPPLSGSDRVDAPAGRDELHQPDAADQQPDQGRDACS